MYYLFYCQIKLITFFESSQKQCLLNIKLDQDVLIQSGIHQNAPYSIHKMLVELCL